MKKHIILILVIFLSTSIKAQIIKKKSIDITIGYGLSVPYDDVDITGSGFYSQGEYVLSVSKWIDIRPYIGLILAETNSNESEYKSISNAFLAGSKIRVSIPFPWVAPYLEAGIGTSIGSFETFTPQTDIKENGILLHLPISLGLKIGPKHNFDIAFTYYFHPSVKQFSGAAAIGFSIPLNN